MEWLIGTVCLLIGIGGGTGITLAIKNNQAPEVTVVEKMVEVDNSLTSTDLLQIPCSAEYMEKNGESLCREMFCRMNTRSGNQANAATAQECEAISNIINKAFVIKHCSAVAKSMDYTAEEFEGYKKTCIEFFDRRL